MPKSTNPVTAKSGVSINIILTLIVLVIAVLVIGGVLLLHGGGNGSQQAGNSNSAPAEVLNKPDSHKLSQAPDNKVTVTEFLDFQCPSCAQYYMGVTKKLEQDYHGRINFVPRNYPLEQAHPLAIPAAKASEAAALQGKYPEMYTKLYDSWQTWAVNGQSPKTNPQEATATFEQYAQQLGLDVNKFRQDVNSPQVQQRLDQDKADGDKIGIQGTPTIFVNGQKFDPKNANTVQQINDSLRGMIDAELKR